jgi:hypothetical protein
MKVQIDLKNRYDDQGITAIPIAEAVEMFSGAAGIIKQDEHAFISKGFDGVVTMEVYPPQIDSDFTEYIWLGHWQLTD